MRLFGRTRNVSLLILVVVVLPVAWMSLFSNSGNNELVVDAQLSELRSRLYHAETLNKEREVDLQKLRSQLKLVLSSHTHGNKTYSSDSMLMPVKAHELLANLSHANVLRPPNIYYYLPHLVKNPSGLEPAVKMSSGRMGVSVVVGIPHVKREINYLYTTLNSLFAALSDEEKLDSMFIVFIGELSDADYINTVCTDLQARFPAEMESGLLEVLAPSPAYYPDFTTLKQTFGDSLERVKWRTKQNLDFAYLMLYARMRGSYYLQLEDDVECKPGFVTIIKNFVATQQTEWILLEFSHLGFIGKLFKSSDLPMIVEFFLMFHRDKPIDWLLDHLLSVKVCSPEITAKQCERLVAEIRRRYKPSLFQHIGVHSSLKGKVQKLKDRDFGRPQAGAEPKLLPRQGFHLNPPAQVSTSLEVYQRYTFDQAYRGDGVFWCKLPHHGDTITIVFTPPIVIAKFSFTSGNSEHPGDRFFDTTVEVKVKDEAVLKTAAEMPGYKLLADNFLQVGEFDHSTGKAVGQPGVAVGLIEVLRLSVHTDSQAWVILSEVTIEPLVANATNDGT